MGKRAKGDSGSRQKAVKDDRDYTLITLVKIASKLGYKVEEILQQKYTLFLSIVEAVNYLELQDLKYQAALHGAKQKDIDNMDGESNSGGKIVMSWDDLAGKGFGKKGSRFNKPKKG